MGRINNLSRAVLDAFLMDCHQCSDELNHFLSVLRECKSLKDEALESFGYVCDKEASELGSDNGFRRRYRVELNGCGGTVRFSWKKSVVDSLKFDCYGEAS